MDKLSPGESETRVFLDPEGTKKYPDKKKKEKIGELLFQYQTKVDKTHGRLILSLNKGQMMLGCA